MGISMKQTSRLALVGVLKRVNQVLLHSDKLFLGKTELGGTSPQRRHFQNVWSSLACTKCMRPGCSSLLLFAKLWPRGAVQIRRVPRPGRSNYLRRLALQNLEDRVSDGTSTCPVLALLFAVLQNDSCNWMIPNASMLKQAATSFSLLGLLVTLYFILDRPAALMVSLHHAGLACRFGLRKGCLHNARRRSSQQLCSTSSHLKSPRLILLL